jgi:hypothetical protein
MDLSGYMHGKLLDSSGLIITMQTGQDNSGEMDRAAKFTVLRMFCLGLPQVP